jgi:hypothetical protein
LSQAWEGSGRAAITNVRIRDGRRLGTRLMREWHGVTHTALIHADGIE